MQDSSIREEQPNTYQADGVTYQADGVKWTDECPTGAGWPSDNM